MKNDQIAQDLILALRRFATALSASNRATGAELGIKPGDLAVLDALHQDGPQTPSELAARTVTHLATMTGILARLERGGWIERRPDSQDRRSVRIHATGVERLTKLHVTVNQRIAKLIAGWPRTRVKEVAELLTQASYITEEFARDLAERTSSPSDKDGAST